MGESKFNLGTVTFATFSALSFFVCLAKGLVPIYLFESIFWAGLAWYWKSKNIINVKANVVILVFALVVAAGEGYIVGHQVGFSEGHWASDPYGKYSSSRAAPPGSVPVNPPAPLQANPSAEFQTTPIPPPGYVPDRPAKAPTAGPESPNSSARRTEAGAASKKKLTCSTGLPAGIVPTPLEESDLAKIEGTFREGWYSFVNGTHTCITSVTIEQTYKDAYSFELRFAEPLAPGDATREAVGGAPTSWKIVKAMGFPASPSR